MATSFFTTRAPASKMAVMRIFSRLVMIFVLTLGVTLAPASVRAQERNTGPTLRDTLPVEVALMYQKLLKQEPNYNTLIAANSGIQNDPTRFGNAVLMKQQFDALKKIYDGFTPTSVFMVKKRVRIKDANTESRMVEITDLSADDPFLFDLTDQDGYAIFLRNAKTVSSLAPPYEFDEFRWLNGWRSSDASYPAEIVVRPLAADTVPFALPDGRMVKPIVADVVEITLLGTAGQQIALKKRFNDWKPEAPVSPLMELKDDPIQNALPK